MRKLFTVLSVSAFFIACNKSSTDINNSPSFMKYKVNGVQVQINDTATGLYPGFHGYVSSTKYVAMSSFPVRYDFDASGTSSSSASGVGFLIFSDSIKIQNYHYDSTSLSKYNSPNVSLPVGGLGLSQAGSLSYMFYSGDYYDVNITSYSGGRISGNFTAKASPASSAFDKPTYATRGTAIITEGEFQNIKVRY